MEKDFLQSEQWRNFQKAAGRRTFLISDESFHASIIEHKLSIVGKYFYIPRWPSARILNSIRRGGQIPNKSQNTKNQIQNLINLAKEENVGWIRIEPASEDVLNLLGHQMSKYKIVKAPHDMQPREILVMDIAKNEEELLAGMKAKTRYNIKVAQKHGVKILVTHNSQLNSQKYLEKFLELIKITSERDRIIPHPENYYRKMFETIPPEILKLCVAKYEGKIIAANIVIHYGSTATYLHGASDSEYRNVMAPYLLQWQAILDAKEAGYHFYDLGGVKTENPKSEINQSSAFTFPDKSGNSSKPSFFKNSAGGNWQGITRFKTGFAPDTKPMEFPGSYDIIISNGKYFLYKFIRKFIP